MFPSNFNKYVETFISYFNFENGQVFYCPDKYPQNLKRRDKRKCRFCGKDSTTTTFKSDSHVIPKALGNHYLISDFECDKCNSVFSKYETDLINFIGLSRSISTIKGRKKHPNFKSKDLKATKTLLFNELDVLNIEAINSNDAKITQTSATEFEIRYTKSKYKPINVYKALYKIALSCMPNYLINEYYLGLEFLKDSFPIQLKTGLKIHTFRLDKGYSSPFGILFERNSNKSNTLKHTFVLFYDTFMFQILLPFNSSDYSRKNNLDFPVFPPFYGGDKSASINVVYSTIREFCKHNYETTDEEIFKLKLDEKDVANTIAINEEKKIVTDIFDINSIKSLALVLTNKTIQLK